MFPASQYHLFGTGTSLKNVQDSETLKDCLLHRT
jgi:hypothetical protein